MSSPRKILKGFFYTVGSGYVARFFSVALTVFIRRELGPDGFIDVVLGATLFTMLSSLREFGLLHALLHYQDRVEEFVGTHFTLNLLITLAAALLGSAIVLALVLLFPETFSWTVALVVWVFFGLHLVRNLALTSEALLRMDFEFGRLSLFHGLGTVLALSATLLAGRAGWEEWSLILGGWSTFSVFSVVYVLFFSTATWRSHPLKIWPLQLDRVWCRRLLGYGVWIWTGWILQTFIMGYDKLVVGLMVGGTELALYENAWWVVQIPTAIITHIIFTYTNTLYSRYQNDRERLSNLFSRIMGLVVRVSSPLALVVVLNAREVMALMPEWAPSAPILVWLAGYAFLRPLLDDGYGLLWAVGDTQMSARILGGQAVVALLLMPLMASQWGVKGVAYSMGIVAGVGAVGLFIGVRNYVTVQWAKVFVAPVLGLSVVALVGVFYSRWALQAALADLILRSALMLLVYAGMLWLLERKSLMEGFAQVRRIMHE